MDNSESAEYKPASSWVPGQLSGSDHLSGLNVATSVGNTGKLGGKGKEEVRPREEELLIAHSKQSHTWAAVRIHCVFKNKLTRKMDSLEHEVVCF